MHLSRSIGFIHFFISLVLCLASCHRGKTQAQEQPLHTDSIRYAKGFIVEHFEDYTSVKVRDPWDSTRLLQHYLLVERDKKTPANLPKGTIVRTPVQRMVVYTSVHASAIEQLGEVNSIVGVCEARFIDSPTIQERIRQGLVSDLGESTAPNIERIMEIGTEALIASPFQNSSYGTAEKLGIPIIEGADYMETLPLGRTEWIRFFGMLFEKTNVADSIFQATEKRYLDLKKLVDEADLQRPKILVERKFGASWFLPGGDSYIANLYKDAGADYLFNDLAGGGSVPLAFEKVLERAIHADIWILKYYQDRPLTYADLKAEYSPYAEFDAYTKQKIYACNTATTPFYEDIPMHPDYLLKDMIQIFHPQLMKKEPLRFYAPLAN